MATRATAQTAEEAYLAAEKTRVRKLFEEKKLRISRYRHEHNQERGWFAHPKHVLICSWAGRPIYSRYGDESKLAAYMGVISAIISNFQRCNDTVRSLVAGPYKFVFLVEGPIYLVAVSRTGESETHLRLQLQAVHLQILTVLTGGVHARLRNRPQYDVRSAMDETTEMLLSELVHDTDTSPAFYLESTRCLRLDPAKRERIGKILKSQRTKNLLFAVLLNGFELVSLVRTKDRKLSASDLYLLSNFVNNSLSLRSGEAWAPICLPGVSRKGYVWLYVCFLRGDLSLSLITADKMDFFQLQEVKRRIVEQMDKSREELGPLERLPSASSWTILDINTEIHELVHFLYKSHVTSQYVMPTPTHPFKGPAGLRQLVSQYKRVWDNVQVAGSPKGNTVYFQTSRASTVLAWIRPGEFEIYCTFTPLVAKEVAITACNRALRWIKREESSLFMLQALTW